MRLIMAEIDFDGNIVTKTYTRWDDYHEDTFCPDYTTLWLTDFKIHGKTYAEQKACAKDIGISYSNAMGTWYPSWSELAEVTSILENIAKRYGLIKEFKENGLI